jgi:hypothetical protein
MGRTARRSGQTLGLPALILVAAAGTLHADTPSSPLSLGSCSLLGAKAGEVKTLFWELYNHTEVCVNLVPDPGPSGPSPFVLTFSFTHTGRQMTAPPATVLLRAQLPPNYVVLSPSLDVVLDATEHFDLTTPGQPYRLTYPPQCTMAETGCGFTGIEVPLTPETFRRWARARAIAGKAFGIAFSLPPEARESLGRFAERVFAAP